MGTRAVVRGVVGLGLLGVMGLMGCGHSGGPVQQQPMGAMAPASGEGGMGAPVAAVPEIHVNQDCLILQDRMDGVQGIGVPGAVEAAGGESDAAVCHLESQLTSNHVKGTVVNGAVQRSVVVVKEQQYLMRDPFAEPVVFVVEHAVPEGWAIDSQPGPEKMVGRVAVFKVAAQPGQTVKLHVGEEHLITLASPGQ